MLAAIATRIMLNVVSLDGIRGATAVSRIETSGRALRSERRADMARSCKSVYMVLAMPSSRLSRISSTVRDGICFSSIEAASMRRFISPSFMRSSVSDDCTRVGMDCDSITSICCFKSFTIRNSSV